MYTALVNHVFSKAPKIDFRTLIRTNNVFNEDNVDLVRRFTQNSGTATALVHPLYGLSILDKPDNFAESVRCKINIDTYKGYLTRLTQFLNYSPHPILILFDPNMRICLKDDISIKLGSSDEYIEAPEIHTGSPIILLKTYKVPIPRFMNRRYMSINPLSKMGVFYNTFADLGIKNLNITGETGYTLGDKKYGCAYYFDSFFNEYKSSLLMIGKFKKESDYELISNIQNDLIYPGIPDSPVKL